MEYSIYREFFTAGLRRMFGLSESSVRVFYTQIESEVYMGFLSIFVESIIFQEFLPSWLHLRRVSDLQEFLTNWLQPA